MTFMPNRNDVERHVRKQRMSFVSPMAAILSLVLVGHCQTVAQSPTSPRTSRLPEDQSSNDSPSLQKLTGSESGRITAADFSPDGRSLAAGSDSSLVFVWDTRSGEETLCVSQMLASAIGPVQFLSYSSDGKLLVAAGGLSGSVFIVNADTGKTVHELKCKGSIITGKMSPDREMVALSDSHREVTVFPIANPDAKKTLGPFPRDINVIAFSPDSAHVAVCYGRDYPDSVRCFECKSGKSLWESPKSLEHPTAAACFALNGKALVAVGTQGDLRFLDATTGQPLKLGREKKSRLVLDHSDIDRIAALNDGRAVAAFSSSDAKRTLVDLGTPTRITGTDDADSTRLLSGDGHVAIAEKQGVVATTANPDGDELVRVYSPDCSALIVSATLPEYGVRGLALSADGTKAAALFENEIVLLRLSIEQKRQSEQRTVLAKQAEEKRMAAARQAAEEATQREMQAEIDTRERERRLRNTTPAWGEVEDLNVLLEQSGLKFRAFVEFGSKELAAKASGDRFDRQEAAEGAEAHRSRLFTSHFLWTAPSYKVIDKDSSSEDADDDDSRAWPTSPSDGKDRRKAEAAVEQEISVELPFRVADLQESLGPNVSIWDGAMSYAFLTKELTMLPVTTPQELRRVVQNNGFLYLPDSKTSKLYIRVRGSLDQMKSLFREGEKHLVQIQLSQLEVSKPVQWGYYQKEESRVVKMHSPALREQETQRQIAIKKNNLDPNGPPFYFCTKEFPDTPELCIAFIDRVEVARVDGSERQVLFTVEAKDWDKR